MPQKSSCLPGGKISQNIMSNLYMYIVCRLYVLHVWHRQKILKFAAISLIMHYMYIVSVCMYKLIQMKRTTYKQPLSSLSVSVTTCVLAYVPP